MWYFHYVLTRKVTLIFESLLWFRLVDSDGTKDYNTHKHVEGDVV